MMLINCLDVILTHLQPESLKNLLEFGGINHSSSGEIAFFTKVSYYENIVNLFLELQFAYRWLQLLVDDLYRSLC